MYTTVNTATKKSIISLINSFRNKFSNYAEYPANTKIVKIAPADFLVLCLDQEEYGGWSKVDPKELMSEIKTWDEYNISVQGIAHAVTKEGKLVNPERTILKIWSLKEGTMIAIENDGDPHIYILTRDMNTADLKSVIKKRFELDGYKEEKQNNTIPKTRIARGSVFKCIKNVSAKFTNVFGNAETKIIKKSSIAIYGNYVEGGVLHEEICIIEDETYYSRKFDPNILLDTKSFTKIDEIKLPVKYGNSGFNKEYRKYMQSMD